jgi:hypothetical protein
MEFKHFSLVQPRSIAEVVQTQRTRPPCCHYCLPCWVVLAVMALTLTLIGIISIREMDRDTEQVSERRRERYSQASKVYRLTSSVEDGPESARESRGPLARPLVFANGWY